MAALPAPGPWDSWVSQEVDGLAQRRLLRSLRPVLPTESPVQVLVPPATHAAWLADQASTGEDAGDGAGVLVRLFSTNDYLGLSAHPAVREAAAAAAAAHGSGPRASALVAGYTGAHRALERALAAAKGSEECLLFPTGFAANCSLLAALAGSPDVAVFSDALNHASIVDGCRLAARAGASVSTYAHGDAAAAEAALAASAAPRKLLVTDALFSMDGDWAPLRALAAACRRHGALLVSDDAHCTLLGRGGGEGLADCVVGTLSKAVGSLGGFVACSRAMKQLLITRARGQVYSTALPLPAVAAAAAALRVCASEPWIAEALWARCAQFQALTGLAVASPIVAIHIGDEARALQAAAQLLRLGFHVPAIRPPTVPQARARVGARWRSLTRAPQGTARLRVALSAAHSARDVEELAEALRAVGVLPPRSRL